MTGMRAAAFGAAMALWVGQAAAVVFPKPEDFKPVGVPVEAEQEHPAAPDVSAPGVQPVGHESPGHAIGPGEVNGEGHETGHHPVDGAGDGHGQHAAHAFHRHHAALFGGAVFHHEIMPAVGVDYEFRFGNLFGLMAMVEAVFGHEMMQMYGLGLAWHAYGPLRIALAPALEMEGHHTAFLIRANAECGFHLGGVSVGPSVSLDFASGHMVPVAGLVLGKGF